MTLSSKIWIIAVITGVAGGGWYQVEQIRHCETAIANLSKQTVDHTPRIQRLRTDLADLEARVAAQPTTAVPAITTGDTTFNFLMEAKVARVRELRKWLAQNRKQAIPEFQFLKDTDWFAAISDDVDFNGPDAATRLKDRAMTSFAPLLQSAIRGFAEENQGQLPSDISQLVPFFLVPVDAAILNRYEMRATGSLANIHYASPLIGEKLTARTDPSRKAKVIGKNAEFIADDSLYTAPFFSAGASASPELANAISKANQAYETANQGAKPTEAAQIISYFQNPGDAQKFLQLQNSPPSPELTAESLYYRARYDATDAYRADHHGAEPDLKSDPAILLPYFQNDSDREQYRRESMPSGAKH